jgi:hypothetical protein
MEDNKSQLHTIKRKRKGNGNNGSTFARGNSAMLGDSGGFLESSLITPGFQDIDPQFTQANINLSS